MDKLTERLARGDPAAFADLYDQCADRLHHYLCFRLGSRDEADDVLQEIFIRLVRSRKRLVGVENVIAYLYQMARNEAARHAGRRPRTPQTFDSRKSDSLAAEELFCESSAADAESRELAESVARGLSLLAEEQREIVDLHVYCGLGFRVIAEVLGVPQGTVASRYRAAIAALRLSLTGELS